MVLNSIASLLSLDAGLGACGCSCTGKSIGLAIVDAEVVGRSQVTLVLIEFQQVPSELSPAEHTAPSELRANHVTDLSRAQSQQ